MSETDLTKRAATVEQTAADRLEPASTGESGPPYVPNVAVPPPSGMATLKEALNRSPGASQAIEDVLRSRLARDIDPRAALLVYDGVAAVVGTEAASTLLDVLLRGADGAGVAPEVLSDLSPEVGAWIRRLVGLYSNELKQCSLVDGREPEGWKEISRRIIHDVASGQWLVRLDVVRNDGTRASIQDDPSAILHLGDFIVESLCYLPPAVAAAMDRNRLDQLRDHNERLLKLATLISGGPEGEPADRPDDEPA